ncbi:MAG: GNAT family N-acetyltransferase [Planktomarina sp.]
MRLGQYQAHVVSTSGQRQAALDLRADVFRAGADDRDAWDDICTHYTIERVSDGTVLCAFRVLILDSGKSIDQSYAAQHYDLTALQSYPHKMLELGRFCLHPDAHDPEILRLAWAVLTRVVDGQDIGMMFGCSSFEGTNAAPYEHSLAMLADRHLAPLCMAPRPKAAYTFPLRKQIKVDRKAGLQTMPPLLKTYLGMGGWVSDHAVIDHDLGTFHVFTGVEIAKVPAPRAKALRALAAMD